LSRAGVEGDDVTALATDIHQQCVSFDQRPTDGPEEAFACAELFLGIDRPEFCAVGDVQACQNSGRRECKYPPIGNGGCSARAIATAEVILVSGRIFVMPGGFAGIRLDAIEAFFVADAVKEDQATVGDGWRAETLADFHLPEDLGTFFGPVEVEG